MPVRANLFDASALLKVFSDEPGSDRVREYFNSHSPTKYTTPFCFYETLNLLKSKWRYRNELTHQQYSDSCFKLMAWYRAATRFGSDKELTEPSVLFSVLDLVKRHGLDVSDAFQIQSVKTGYFSCLINESSTLLVTADQGLAAAATAEGIKTWYVFGEPIPPD